MFNDSDSNHILVSLVVPVYNECEVIEEFHNRATQALAGIEKVGYEIIFVDDGSADESYQRLAELATRDSHVRVLKFSRNFGHQIAITAGMHRARGDCVVTIDADLQDPPELVASMLDKWKEGFDVVYCRRERRKGEKPMKLLTASMFYRLLGKLSKIEIPNDVGDFRLMSRRAVDQLNRLNEKDRYVRGLVSWVGLRQTSVSYTRDVRFAGETKYPYKKMVKFALDGITSFSTLPLQLATWLGYAASLFAFVYMVNIFVQKAVGNTVPGFATIMVAMLFLGGVQLICLGIMGEYLGRVFNEIKRRPMYIIEEELPTGSIENTEVDQMATSRVTHGRSGE